MATRGFLLKGKGASPGKTTAPANIILDFKDISKMQQADILVTKMTSPPWLPIMVKASAVITEEGGVLSHPAIVCRELGIPAIVSVENATQILKDGMIITIDGTKGEIYEKK